MLDGVRVGPGDPDQWCPEPRAVFGSRGCGHYDAQQHGGGGKSRPLSDLYNLQFRNVFTFLNGWGRKTNQRQNNSS